jgi:hypothetical protein
MLPLTATRICAVIGGTRLFIAVLGFAFFSFLTRVLRLPDPRPTQSRYQILDCNTHLAAGMQDETFSANKQLRSRGQPARRRQQTNSSIDIRLTPIPRPNGISLLISIFPRAQLSNLNDATAERKVNTALAGPRSTAAGEPQSATLGGITFLASEFEQREPLLKHAKVYTTICKTQLVFLMYWFRITTSR